MKRVNFTKTSTHYERSPGVVIVSLKGNFDPPQKFKASYFNGSDWFIIARKEAAETIRRWKKKNEKSPDAGATE